MIQQSFEFVESPSYAAEDFIITNSNQLAFAKIVSWPGGWRHATYPYFLLIYGQKHCGKTHLANIWRGQTLASFVFNHQVLLSEQPGQNLIIEDIDNPNWCETSLFHLFNFCHEMKIYCLFTSSSFPVKFQLPDLASRLNSVDTIKISQPDLDTIKIFIGKEFSKKSLQVEQKVIELLAEVIPLNFHLAIRAVSLLNQESLACNKPISCSMIKRIFLT